MSMLSKWIDRQVKKKGIKAFIIWILDIVTKATKNKNDDAMVEKMKKVMKEFDQCHMVKELMEVRQADQKERNHLLKNKLKRRNNAKIWKEIP